MAPPTARLSLRDRRAFAARLDRLDRHLDEVRQVGQRIESLTDVVAELLLPPEQRDDARLRAAIASFRTVPGSARNTAKGSV